MQRAEHRQGDEREGDARAPPPTTASTRLSVSTCRTIAPPARAERGAQGELRAPRGAPHQQQVGDVGAGDEQHQPDRAEQDQQRRPGVLHDVVVQRHRPDPEVRGRVLLELLPELGGDPVHLGLGLGEGHARA